MLLLLPVVANEPSMARAHKSRKSLCEESRKLGCDGVVPAFATASVVARFVEGRMMTDYLPNAYKTFRDRHGDVASSLDGLAADIDRAGPLDERSRRLVKLGIAIGRGSEGAVKSSTRKARALGVTDDEIRHAALLAVTTTGLPAATAAMTWIDEVVDGA